MQGTAVFMYENEENLKIFRTKVIQLIGKNWNNGTIINTVPGKVVSVSGYDIPGFRIFRHDFSIHAKFVWDDSETGQFYTT